MKRRVLVIDDDPLVADTLSLVFEANGFQTEACYSASDGLARARSFAPELLLCDVTLPEETGFELAEKVHREIPSCKILLLTAYSGNIAQAALYADQTKRPLKLLSKPCHPEQLLEEAEALLRIA